MVVDTAVLETEVSETSAPESLISLDLPELDVYLPLWFRRCLTASEFHEDLEILRKKVQHSRSNVQRQLSLGVMGVYEENSLYDWDMDEWKRLWEAFYSVLLRQYRLLVKLEKILAVWEKLLCLLLLYFSISEFSSPLRPPCTTMPWTIWPALVVLWGVCWMFYDQPFRNSGDQEAFSTAWNTARLFEEGDYIDPSLVYNSNYGDTTYDRSFGGESYLDLPDLEKLLQQYEPGTTSSTAMFLSPVPTPEQLPQPYVPGSNPSMAMSQSYLPTSLVEQNGDFFKPPVQFNRTRKMNR